MTVPFLDLKAQYASIKREVDEAVLRVLASTTYVLGPEVEAFEKEFAARHNVKHAVAVNTGTSALHVALLAAGVKAGDEVITVSMSTIRRCKTMRLDAKHYREDGTCKCYISTHSREQKRRALVAKKLGPNYFPCCEAPKDLGHRDGCPEHPDRA